VDYFEKIREATDPTDSNGDGISDYYTRVMTQSTLYTGAKTKVFGNATFEEVQANSDFDHDGLLNGDELTIEVRTGLGAFALGGDTEGTYVYAVLSSDPTSTDGDGDGYGDLTETRWHLTHGGTPKDPLVSEVVRHALRQDTYVSVGLTPAERGSAPIATSAANRTDVSYGGSQMWFSDQAVPGLGDPIHSALTEHGCGLVALVDLYTYLGSRNPRYFALADPLRQSPGFTSFSPLRYESYADFHYERSRGVLRFTTRPGATEDALPILAPDIDFPATGGVSVAKFGEHATNYFRSYLDVDDTVERHTADRVCEPPPVFVQPANCHPTDPSIVSDAFIRSLDDNVPVPIAVSVAPTFYYSQDNARVIAADQWRDLNRDGTINIADYAGYLSLDPNAAPPGPGDNYIDLSLLNQRGDHFKNHYVNITEYIEDGFDGRDKLVFSSWGQELVIPFNELDLGKFGGWWEVVQQ
jgi:hypothetical protein